MRFCGSSNLLPLLLFVVLAASSSSTPSFLKVDAFPLQTYDARALSLVIVGAKNRISRSGSGDDGDTRGGAVPSASTSTPLRMDSFSVPFDAARKTTMLENLQSLWTDPRPATDVLFAGNSEPSVVGEDDGDGAGVGIPYVLTSGPFRSAGLRFEVLIYPRRLLARPSSSSSSAPVDASGATPASAYLRYLPDARGDEIDVAWTLRLVDGRRRGVDEEGEVDNDDSTECGVPLNVSTSGGLPRSRTTWSSAMTLCDITEAVTGAGRTNDWGSTSWISDEVCDALRGGKLRAEGNITVFDYRRNEKSLLSWPPGRKGGLGAILKAAAASNDPNGRLFRAGELIIIPSTSVNGVGGDDDDDEDNSQNRVAMERANVYPGVEYRVMTLTDEYGNMIFSTESLSPDQRGNAKLALRPIGWKTQQLMWEQRGVKPTDWPVEVEASVVSRYAQTRFNIETFPSRLMSWIAADGLLVVLAFFALAIAPVPVALAARNFVSLYDIPSASMDPTLRRGDVLLVEKFPRAYDRIGRGDVALFVAPPALDEIIVSRGGRSTAGKRDVNNPFGGESLFVKRVVGLPGDKDIEMDPETEDVSINGAPAVGPDRNMCDDEPLKLIDKLLEDGKGKNIPVLGENDVYVLGDCKAVSVDSRVFGVLPKKLIVGRPIARIFPLARFTVGPGFKL